MTPLLHDPKAADPASDDSTFTEAAGLTFKMPERAPAREAAQDACLVHIYPPDRNLGRRYPLTEASTRVGRGDDCAIRYTDSSISRRHALITRGGDGRYTVTDLGSTNGTFVNNASRRQSPLRDGDYLRVGNCLYRFLAGGDVEAAYHEEIYRLTIRDGLTLVHNRRYFTEFLAREVFRAARHKRSAAVILLDIDRLKAVNDRLGYLAGDMTLREFCARVQILLRPDELLARTGGSEFAVVLPEGNADSARATAERIRLSVEKLPFAFNTRTYWLTVSAGVAAFAPGEGPTADALLNLAATNLARAKLAAGNRVVVS